MTTNKITLERVRSIVRAAGHKQTQAARARLLNADKRERKATAGRLARTLLAIEARKLIEWHAQNGMRLTIAQLVHGEALK